MDATLDEIADSLLNQRLPDNWRKLAPETCMQLAAWLNHLQVNRAIERSAHIRAFVSIHTHTHAPHTHAACEWDRLAVKLSRCVCLCLYRCVSYLVYRFVHQLQGCNSIPILVFVCLYTFGVNRWCVHDVRWTFHIYLSVRRLFPPPIAQYSFEWNLFFRTTHKQKHNNTNNNNGNPSGGNEYVGNDNNDDNELVIVIKPLTITTTTTTTNRCAYFVAHRLLWIWIINCGLTPSLMHENHDNSTKIYMHAHIRLAQPLWETFGNILWHTRKKINNISNVLSSINIGRCLANQRWCGYLACMHPKAF